MQMGQTAPSGSYLLVLRLKTFCKSPASISAFVSGAAELVRAGWFVVDIYLLGLS
jgi:hypothetical protein